MPDNSHLCDGRRANERSWGVQMRTVSVAKASEDFSVLLDAVQHETVLIQCQKHDVAVLMSMEEYQRLAQLNVAEFQRFCDQVGRSAEEAGMTQDILASCISS